MLIDLKLYQGDLRAQIEAALPAGFSLFDFLGELRPKLFLDAYNEMPSNYSEDGSLLRSMEKLRDELGDFEYVITSRTSDGLPTQDLFYYELARFDLDHVDGALAKCGIVLSGHFEDDIRRLLSRPFFLHLVTNGTVSVPEGARPGDIYGSFLHNLQHSFVERFSINVPITSALSRTAYRALDNGREAFPLAWLTDQLLMLGDPVPSLMQDIVNWLIAREVLIPYSGARVSFVHQSITEYCAALELVRLCEAGLFSLRDTVALKKWDQCLFLALAMMPRGKAEEVLDFLIRADVELAFSAVRYADHGQSAAITKLLTILVEGGRDSAEWTPVRFGLLRLPFDDEHTPYLERLLQFGGSIAGEAVQALALIRGTSIKPTLLELLSQQKSDYNFSVNGIAHALAPLLDETDLPRLLEIAVEAASMPESEIAHCAVGDLLAYFEPDVVIAAARDHVGSPLPHNLIKILCRALREREDIRSFEILADFVLGAHDAAVTGLYFSLPRDKGESVEMASGLSLNHVRAVWRCRFTAELWHAALHKLCSLRSDFASEMASIAKHTDGIERIAILFCIDADPSILREQLERLALRSEAELVQERFEIFQLSRLDWTGTGSLYPRLLINGVHQLRRSLLGNSCPCHIKGLGLFGPDVLIPVVEMAAALPHRAENSWVRDQLGSIVAHHGDKAVRQYVLDQLAHGSLETKHWVKISVLRFCNDVSTDDMSEDAVAFLLADLSRANAFSPWNNPIGRTATERFVNERIIPLARGASETVLTNLSIVLKTAGDRHGCRYLLPN